MPEPHEPRAAGRIRRQTAILIEAVMEAEAEVRHGHPADAALSARFHAHREYGSRDRRLISSTVFSLFRWRGWTGSFEETGGEALAHAWLVDQLEPLPPPLAALMNEPVPALPTATAVETPEDRLARRIRFESEWCGVPCRSEDLFPEWFYRELARDDPDPAEAGPSDSGFDRLAAHLQVRPPLWLKAVGMSGADLARQLKSFEVEARAASDVLSAVRIEGAPNLSHLERKSGLRFYAQDLASQRVVAACDAKPGERWWDACAGAGGKSLGLLEAVGPHGEVWSSDLREEPLAIGQRRAEALRLPRLNLYPLHAAHRIPAVAAFDGVLVDAPCSGTGTWGRNPDARWRTSEESVAARATQQREILCNTARAVRSGGTLVYSTCSILPIENRLVTEAFLDTHPDFVFTATQTFWPWHGPQNGMFVAVFRKK